MKFFHIASSIPFLHSSDYSSWQIFSPAFLQKSKMRFLAIIPPFFLATSYAASIGGALKARANQFQEALDDKPLCTKFEVNYGDASVITNVPVGENSGLFLRQLTRESFNYNPLTFLRRLMVRSSSTFCERCYKSEHGLSHRFFRDHRKTCEGWRSPTG